LEKYLARIVLLQFTGRRERKNRRLILIDMPFFRPNIVKGYAIIRNGIVVAENNREPARFSQPKQPLIPACVRVIPTFAKVGEPAETAVAAMNPGDILCLENTRYHAEEEKNDPAFVAALAKLGDVYVNDAFSVAHRAHASTEGLAHKLPAFAGLAMQDELDALEKALEAPKKPVIAVIGGTKVSTKLDLIGNLIAKVDGLVIGGGMANTFLHAQGINIGKSLAEKDMAGSARDILAKAARHNCAIILPIDAIVAYYFEANAPAHDYGVNSIPPDGMILDVGPNSVERIKAVVDDAATLVWNGPLGAFEILPFDKATVAIARYAAARTKAGKLISVAGGGDTVAALNHAGVVGDFTYVSTAGGAFLEWMEGKALPGVEALRIK